MRGGKANYDKALWLLQRAKEIADYTMLSEVRASSWASARRSRRCATCARTASTSSRSAGSPTEPEARIDRRWCARAFAGSASRARRTRLGLLRPARWLSYRPKPQTNSATQPRPAAGAPSPTSARCARRLPACALVLVRGGGDAAVPARSGPGRSDPRAPGTRAALTVALHYPMTCGRPAARRRDAANRREAPARSRPDVLVASKPPPSLGFFGRTVTSACRSRPTSLASRSRRGACGSASPRQPA